MNVVLINTGTELLLGSVLNTHLNFIAREIFPFGLRISRQVTVPDGDPIRDALRVALKEAEIIFVTGGLGPTTDDITRELTAELLGRQLRQDDALAEKITERLRVRGFPMTDRILRQALVPEGATILPNDNGTAPGLYLASKNAHVFLLPGPPRELQPMFRESVAPILRGLVRRDEETECHTFRLTGVGESMVEAAIGKELLALPEIELGYCARLGEVDVRLLGRAEQLEAADALVRGAFPRAIFSTSDEQLEEVVVHLLTEKQQTLAIAESCTGGALANRLTNVSGSSAVLLAGFVTYSNDAKTRDLGVSKKILEQHGAVSAETAITMAEGAREKTSATFSLATTGIAGPTGGTDDKPVGTVFIALAKSDDETQVKSFRFLAERESFKRLVTQHALEMLRQRLF